MQFLSHGFITPKDVLPWNVYGNPVLEFIIWILAPAPYAHPGLVNLARLEYPFPPPWLVPTSPFTITVVPEGEE